MTELLAAAQTPASYLWLKWIHVLGVIIYIGGLLTLTRVLGRAVKFETAASRDDAYRIFRRMHKLVDWGGLALLLGAGLWLVMTDPMGKSYLKQGYFHLKLTCFFALVVCDIVLTRKLFRMTGEGEQPSPTLFRILHGIAGLALMGALFAVFVVRG